MRNASLRFSIFSAMSLRILESGSKASPKFYFELKFSSTNGVEVFCFLGFRNFQHLVFWFFHFRQFHWFSDKSSKLNRFLQPFFLPLGKKRYEFWVFEVWGWVLSFWAECNGVEKSLLDTSTASYVSRSSVMVSETASSTSMVQIGVPTETSSPSLQEYLWAYLRILRKFQNLLCPVPITAKVHLVWWNLRFSAILQFWLR